MKKKKYNVMKDAYRLMFKTNKDAKEKLRLLDGVIQYKCIEMLEYWDCRSGNHLGKLLSELRVEYFGHAVVNSISQKQLSSVAQDVELRLGVYDFKHNGSLADVFFARPSNVKSTFIDSSDIELEYVKIITTPPVDSKNEEPEVPVDSKNEEPEVPVDSKNEEPEVPVDSKNEEPEVPVDSKNEEPEVPVVMISFDNPDNVVDGVLSIPIAERKLISGEEIDDHVIIDIAKTINKLRLTRNVCMSDNANWYSLIIEDLCTALLNKEYDYTTTHGAYAKEVMERNATTNM